MRASERAKQETRQTERGARFPAISLGGLVSITLFTLALACGADAPTETLGAQQQPISTKQDDCRRSLMQSSDPSKERTCATKTESDKNKKSTTTQNAKSLNALLAAQTAYDKELQKRLKADWKALSSEAKRAAIRELKASMLGKEPK